MRCVIRPEAPADVAQITSVHDAAFGGSAEGELVAKLRRSGDLVLSLAAAVNGEIIGHVAFSRLRISEGPSVRAISLAPVAVLPAHQGRGIGTALIERGLRDLRETGEALVMVLGDPAYYGRFGFSCTLARRFKSPWQGDSFQAAWLANPVSDCGGVVHYPEAFLEMDE